MIYEFDSADTVKGVFPLKYLSNTFRFRKYALSR